MPLAWDTLKNLYSRREIWVPGLLLALDAGGEKIKLHLLIKARPLNHQSLHTNLVNGDIVQERGFCVGVSLGIRADKQFITLKVSYVRVM